jgi:hypothetical protein
MSLEDTTNELANIRQAIFDLKEMEEIYLLAKFSHDAKEMLRQIDEIQIHVIFREKELLKKFKTKYNYHSDDGKTYSEEQPLYIQLRCCNGKFRENNYVEEYKVVAALLEKNMVKDQVITINPNTTPEEFLRQLDPEYAIKYAHYELNKSLSINGGQKKTKYKI